jgi:hypothetical protein
MGGAGQTMAWGSGRSVLRPVAAGKGQREPVAGGLRAAALAGRGPARISYPQSHQPVQPR